MEDQKSSYKVPVTLSSASVYPLSVHDAFAMAKDVGYDGIEVLVTGNAASQSASALKELMDKYQLPILAIHAPTLLLTQQVWGSAWAKIERSVILAQAVGASVVVAHPPFRWQGAYAENFGEGVRRLIDTTGMKIAVENMYPWRARGREAKMYLPHWNPVPQHYQHVTWDFSHAAIANMDSRQAVEDLGQRLAHVHLCDGLDNGKDEHLVPGLGTRGWRNPCNICEMPRGKEPWLWKCPHARPRTLAKKKNGWERPLSLPASTYLRAMTATQ